MNHSKIYSKLVFYVLLILVFYVVLILVDHIRSTPLNRVKMLWNQSDPIKRSRPFCSSDVIRAFCFLFFCTYILIYRCYLL